MRRALIVVLLVLVAGCTSSIKLRHPTTGQVAQCGPYHVAPNMGFRYEGVVTREHRCLDDYQRQGFERAP